MFLLRLAVFVLLILFVVFVMTQIIEPMVHGRPLFPFFRKELNDLHSEEVALNEKEVVIGLREVVAQKRAALEAREAELISKPVGVGSTTSGAAPVVEAQAVISEQSKQ